MKKLPFVSEPKSEYIEVGTPESGTVKVQKLYDLTPNERIFIDEQKLPDLRLEAARLSQTIAEKSGKSMVEVYNALTSGDSSSMAEFLVELIEFQNLMGETSKKRQQATATAIIRFRVAKEQDWTLQDTQNPDQIHPKLIQELADFAAKEEAGWETEVAPITEEDLKKSLQGEKAG